MGIALPNRRPRTYASTSQLIDVSALLLSLRFVSLPLDVAKLAAVVLVRSRIARRPVRPVVRQVRIPTVASVVALGARSVPVKHRIDSKRRNTALIRGFRAGHGPEGSGLPRVACPFRPMVALASAACGGPPGSPRRCHPSRGSKNRALPGIHRRKDGRRSPEVDLSPSLESWVGAEQEPDLSIGRVGDWCGELGRVNQRIEWEKTWGNC